MATNPCGLPTNHPEEGLGGQVVGIAYDEPRPIDPDTGTTETWKSYIGQWRYLEQAIIKALRTRLTRKGIDGVSWDRVMEWAHDLVGWGNTYLARQYPTADRIGCLPCGTPQNRRTYPLEGLNLHETWNREQPLWWDDAWESADIKKLWTEYDELYADAVSRGIV